MTLRNVLRLTTILPACLLLSVVSGCNSIGPSLSKCAGFEPIYVTANDGKTMSQQTADKILAHNEYGKAIGCW